MRYSALFCVCAALLASSSGAIAQDAKPIALAGEQAYPESITAGPDGTLYVSTPASGGIQRAKPGGEKAEVWIAPAAFDMRSTFGVHADSKTNTPMAR